MEIERMLSMEQIPRIFGFLEKISVDDGSLEFEWKIPNFSVDANCNAQTPQLEFFGGEFIFKLILTQCDYCIDIVCKMKDGNSDLRTNYSADIKCFNGAVYKSIRGAMVVRPIVCTTTPQKILSRSALLQDKSKVAPFGILRIFCRLSVKEKFCEKRTADSASQTEIFKGIFKLGKNLKDLLTSGEDSDVIMRVGNKEFQAHRAILGARSTVFASMFKHDMKERGCGTVDITDCDPRAFEQFLLYVYTGNIDCLGSENVCQLYQVTDKYDVQDLKTECVEYMKGNISTENFCDVLSLALRHEESALLESATQFFVKNAKKIVTNVNWLSFLTENPVEANELTIKMLNCAVPD